MCQSCSTAELRRVDARLDLEFPNGIHRGANHKSVEVDVGILDAVQGEAVELLPLPCDRDRLVGAVAALAAVRLAVGAHLRGDVRTQLDERKKVSTIERKVNNSSVFDHRAHRGAFGLHGHQRGFHFDRLGHDPDFHLEADPRYVADLKNQAYPGCRLKALQFGLNVVVTGYKEGNCSSPLRSSRPHGFGWWPYL